MSVISCKPNSKGMYRVYAVPYDNKYFVGIATLQDIDNKELNDTTIFNVRLFNGTVLELMAGEIKFDC